MSREPSALTAIENAVSAWLTEARQRPLMVGLCGAQGSGKSTLSAQLIERLTHRGKIAAVISLDDLYLSIADREALAREIHPLLRTRGVPGTHDTALGLNLFERIDAGRAVRLPRFDKARDERVPAGHWDTLAANPDLVVFEGWCVGARPQSPEALAAPVNALEHDEDADGTWRRYANAALASPPYRRLFDRIDRLVLLAAPAFDVVSGWRRQQEQELRRRTGAGMSDREIDRFVQHYERLTRHILAEMPDRADLVVRLNADRSAAEIR